MEEPEGVQTERDKAMRRLDEREIKLRMNEAFDRLIELGYEVALIGRSIRGDTDYRMELQSDGSGDVPINKLTHVAEEFRLDLVVDKTMGLVFYPRW